MISDATKISIAMDLIESKIAKCILKKREVKDEKIEREYQNLLLEKEEIYKGNYEVINKIINEIGEKKND